MFSGSRSAMIAYAAVCHEVCRRADAGRSAGLSRADAESSAAAARGAEAGEAHHTQLLLPEQCKCSAMQHYAVRTHLLHRAADALQQAHDEAVAAKERAVRHHGGSGEEDGGGGDEYDARDVHPDLAVVRHPTAGHGRAQEDDRGEAREDDADRVLAESLLLRLLREEGGEHRVDAVAAEVGEVDAHEDEHLVAPHALLAHGRSAPARRRRRPATSQAAAGCSARKRAVGQGRADPQQGHSPRRCSMVQARRCCVVSARACYLLFLSGASLVTPVDSDVGWSGAEGHRTARMRVGGEREGGGGEKGAPQAPARCVRRKVPCRAVLAVYRTRGTALVSRDSVPRQHTACCKTRALQTARFAHVKRGDENTQPTLRKGHRHARAHTQAPATDAPQEAED
eukprot:scaffold52013_cov70-Phaeocystis_antarctica.AAC.3